MLIVLLQYDRDVKRDKMKKSTILLAASIITISVLVGASVYALFMIGATGSLSLSISAPTSAIIQDGRILYNGELQYNTFIISVDGQSATMTLQPFTSLTDNETVEIWLKSTSDSQASIVTVATSSNSSLATITNPYTAPFTLPARATSDGLLFTIKPVSNDGHNVSGQVTISITFSG